MTKVVVWAVTVVVISSCDKGCDNFHDGSCYKGCDNSCDERCGEVCG